MTPGLLLLALLMAWHVTQPADVTSSQGTQRTMYLIQGLGLALISLLPSWPLMALSAVMLLNLNRQHLARQKLPVVYPWLLAIGAGLAIRTRSDLVWWSLLSLVAMGVWLGLWGTVSLVYGKWWGRRHLLATQDNGWRTYRVGSWLWQMEETDPNYTSCGQENPNNLGAVSAVCTAAVLGLAWSQDPRWLWLVPLVLMPVIAVQLHSHGGTLGLATIGVTVCVAVPMLVTSWAWLLWVPIGLVTVWAVPRALRSDYWWDSGRLRFWFVMLVACWWNRGWTVRLLGHGWSTWLDHYVRVCEIAAQHHPRAIRKGLFRSDYANSTAHNEYVHMLFEHGAIGAACLLWYITTTAWRLAHGSLEAQAVFIVGLACCATALLFHPWTWYHQTAGQSHDPTTKDARIRLYSMGSPAMLYASWITAVCA
ncbi:MAG TPA: hypothetical protein VFS39_15020, partial [Nitrospira sp.]|nr:hypothetical protein [Nitrospira sp.]